MALAAVLAAGGTCAVADAGSGSGDAGLVLPVWDR